MSKVSALNNQTWILAVLGSLLAAVGLLVITGWLLGSMALIQILPGLEAMQFSTGLGFLLSGIGLSKFSQINTLRGCGISVLFIALLSLTEWLSAFNLYISNLFMTGLPTVPDPAPLTLGFLMSGLGLLLYTFRHLQAFFITIVSVLGGLILALGLVGVIDYSLNIYRDYGWQQFIVMELHTAGSFSIVGLSLVLICALDSGKYTQRFSTEMIPFATVLTTLCLSLSIALENKNTTHVRRILQTQLDNRVDQTVSDINFVISALTRGVKRWEMQQGELSQTDWQTDAKLYVETLPYLKILAWLDHPQQSMWYVANDAQTDGSFLRDIIYQLPDSSAQGGVSEGNTLRGNAAHSMSTSKLGKIVVIIAPVNAGNEGFLLGVFGFSALFNDLSVRDEHESSWLNIRIGKDILFTSIEPDLLPHHSYSIKREVTIEGLTFEFEKGFLNDSATQGFGVLSSMVFVTGSLGIFITLIAIYAYQRSRLVMTVLNSEKERFRSVIEAAPGAMLLVDSQGDIEFLNSKAEVLFGYRQGQLLGKNVDMLVPLDLVAKHANLRESFMHTPKFRSMAKGKELFGRHKNGGLIPLEIELCPIKSDQGLKVLASIFDLSERTKQLQAINRSINELDRAGKIAKIGAWQLDIDTQTLRWSQQTYKIHEVPLSVPLSADFADKFYSAADQQLLKQTIEKAMSSKEEWDLELPLTTLMNNKIWVRNQGQIEFQAGKPIRIVGAIQDITERRAVIMELERSNQELNNFAYVASHDLKSPLRGIDQLATWLSEDLAESIGIQTQEHLRLMRSRIHRMENLLDDLLAYSRAGRTKDLTERVALADFVQLTFDFCNTEQRFNLQIIGDTGDYLVVKTPLELVLRNLINNAIKHHDKKHGNIVISISAKNNWLEFSVADDGPGIPAEHSERAFAMFQTLQPRDKVEGSGMGLAIVRKVVESFGGNIELRANQPRGALFRFNFPVMSHAT